LSWSGIPDVVAATLDAWTDDQVDELDSVLAADAEARARAREVLGRRLAGGAAR
jgi:1-deoxy-D-xylulose 5-phosphate reductoisomerase